MNEENKNDEFKKVNEPKKYEGKTYAYIAIGLIAAGAVAFGVSFTVLGIYALIASLILEIAAITFVNLQKKRNDLKWLIYIKIAAYVVFIAAVIVFVGGAVWAKQAKQTE